MMLNDTQVVKCISLNIGDALLVLCSGIVVKLSHRVHPEG